MPRTPGSLRRERLRAGDMQHTISLQSLTVVTDGQTGATRNTYTTEKTLCCSIEPLRGRELLIGQAEEAQMTHRVWFHYDPLITPQKRLVYTDDAGNDHTLDIQSVANVNEANDRMEVMALERQKVA